MRKITTIVLMMLVLSVSAQEFLHIPAIGVDSTFCTQIEVIASSLNEEFGVELLYPEFEPLSTLEAKAAERLGLPKREMPVVETRLGISRGVAKLEVSFVPTVYRDGRWQRIRSLYPHTSTKVKERNNLPPSPSLKDKGELAASVSERYTDKSVLSEGKWYKISVTDEGMYRLTAEKLKEMGFEDPAKVRVYGYGGIPIDERLPMSGDDRLIDDLEEVPLIRMGKDVTFFAEGVTRWTFEGDTWTHRHNPYSTKSYYFVTEGGTPATVEEMTTTAEATRTIENVRYYGLYERDAFGWYEGGLRLHDDYDFVGGNQHTFRVTTPSPANRQQGATLDVAASAAHATATTVYSFGIDKTEVGTMTIGKLGSNTVARENTGKYNLETVSENNDVSITVTAGHHARLNYLRINYDRELRADGAKAFAFVPDKDSRTPVALAIQGATADSHLLMIGRAGEMTKAVKTTLTGSVLTAVVEDPSRRYVIYDTKATTFDTPNLEGSVAPQNLHGDRDYDMVILVPASGKYITEAERLATFHAEADGMNVKVVRADEVYNEFSSGTPDASAVRRYLKMLYDRGTASGIRPAYLLLFGPSAWDNRMLTSDWRGQKPEDYLLAYEGDGSESSIGDVYSYVSDDYYALMDDGESDVLTAMPDIAVGRLTPYSADEAKTFVDKIIAYHNNKDKGAWKSTILMMGDYGDNNSHMEDAERIIKAIDAATQKRYDIQRVYPDTYKITNSSTGNTYPQANKKIHEILERGALIANYSGHGSPTQLSHANLLKSEDFETLSPNHMTHWVLASCEIYPIDSHKECFGEIAMSKPEGGAIAFMCATRAVYASYNNPLNCSYTSLILSNDESGRPMTFGEALRQAKNTQAATSSSARLNKAKYVIIGDPALRLTHPTGDVTIDAINGTTVTGTETVQLKAGSVATIKGHIDEPAFEGTATIRLFDRESRVSTQGHDSDSPYTYTESGKKIYEGRAIVKDSQFEFEVAIPLDISYTDDPARLVVYAGRADEDSEPWGDDTTTPKPTLPDAKSPQSDEVLGISTAFCLNGTDNSVEPDTEGPEVLVYFGNVGFPDGGLVGESAVFMADISDKRGINAAGLSLGHDMTLTLDGDEANAIVLNNYFTYDFGSYAKGHVAYPLQGLSPGEHHLKFRVWDVNNNVTTATLRFNVSKQYDGTFGLTASRNPTQTPTTLIVSLYYSDEPQEVELNICDTYGRIVWTKTTTVPAGQTCLPCQWNLTHNNGAAVPSGLYIATAKVTRAGTAQDSCDTKIIVNRQ